MRQRVSRPSTQHLAQSRLLAIYGMGTASAGTQAGRGLDPKCTVTTLGSTIDTTTRAASAATTQPILVSITAIPWEPIYPACGNGRLTLECRVGAAWSSRPMD